MSDKVKPTDLMSGYEYRTYRGYKKTAADQLKDKAMFRNAVRNRLAMEERVTSLETGEVVNVPAIDLLVDAKLQADLENPSSIDLVKWQKAAGEDVNQQEIQLRGADELFGDIVNK